MVASFFDFFAIVDYFCAKKSMNNTTGKPNVFTFEVGKEYFTQIRHKFSFSEKISGSRVKAIAFDKDGNIIYELSNGEKIIEK